MDIDRPTRAARRADARRIHAPALAEEAAAGARRAGRRAARPRPARACSRSRRGTTSSRAWCARQGERWPLRPGPIAAPRACRRWRRRAGRCWCRASTCTTSGARGCCERFRFVPDARLDDVMVSYASDGGGVGPHVDSYDVFLLQLAGRRRWRIGRAARPRLRDDVPLKMLADFEPSEDWLLEPGDMLYLPPGWAHDGVAVGDCITASIGFRAPAAARSRRRRSCSGSPMRPSTRSTTRRCRRARIRSIATGSSRRPGPGAHSRVAAALRRRRRWRVPRPIARARQRALGEVLSEPKPGTWFERASAGPARRRSRPRSAQPHALRRRPRLPQRRGVSCRRPGCHTDARLGRPRAASSRQRAAGSSAEARGLLARLARGRLVRAEAKT